MHIVEIKNLFEIYRINAKRINLFKNLLFEIESLLIMFKKIINKDSLNLIFLQELYLLLLEAPFEYFMNCLKNMDKLMGYTPPTFLNLYSKHVLITTEIKAISFPLEISISCYDAFLFYNNALLICRSFCYYTIQTGLFYLDSLVLTIYPIGLLPRLQFVIQRLSFFIKNYINNSNYILFGNEIKNFRFLILDFLKLDTSFSTFLNKSIVLNNALNAFLYYNIDFLLNIIGTPLLFSDFMVDFFCFLNVMRLFQEQFILLMSRDFIS